MAKLVALSMLEQRYLVVREELDTGATDTDVAARRGVTRRTLHRWLVRYASSVSVDEPALSSGRARQLNVTDVDRVRLWDRESISCEPLEVHDDRLADELLGLIARCAGDTDTGQGGQIGALAGGGSLVHDGPGAQRSSLDNRPGEECCPAYPVPIPGPDCRRQPPCPA
ncbi:MAG TPA: helix-turn-helix domain-containing protein [Acidimicrobiales bacterium]|nr:helix-turn-helix domain-containing protein [Acidimicrobiales bacterium]HVA05422.1 helix-turn-helix domain-containing protein [Acidimicrobiales bacterium]